MIKRVWRPLDVHDGYRLYEVMQNFPGHPEWQKHFIVSAFKPAHAAKLVKECNKGIQCVVEPYYIGKALDVYMPEEWWTGDIVDDLLQPKPDPARPPRLRPGWGRKSYNRIWEENTLDW